MVLTARKAKMKRQLVNWNIGQKKIFRMKHNEEEGRKYRKYMEYVPVMYCSVFCSRICQEL